MKYKHLISSCLLAGMLGIWLTSCQDERVQAPASLKVTTLATGFKTPIGLEKDASGRVWVGESGTGNNDGKVSVVTPDGKVFPVITGFSSGTIDGGDIDGVDHLLFADGVLYILCKGLLYKANVAGFKPGDAPVAASTIPTENIAQFVLGYNFVSNAHDSHPYNLILGPDGAIFIADAGANAILRRAKTGDLSVLAEIPGIPNPTPVGPPFIQSVPTGLAFDGQKFLVSTLLGFPFPAARAFIYQVDLAGKVSVYQQGFNSLTDVELDGNPGALALEYGVFSLATGWGAKTGRVVRATGTASNVILSGLNEPTDIRQFDANTYYITSAGDGTVLKVTY